MADRRLIRPLVFPSPAAARLGTGGIPGPPSSPATPGTADHHSDPARQHDPAPEQPASAPPAGETRPDAAERYPAPPLAELLDAPGAPHSTYVISRVDASGRISDRSFLPALDWTPGDRIAVSGWRNEAIILRRDNGGTSVISGGGHLQIPSGLRHRCAVGGGDRVLVAAHVGLGTVIVYTMAALERLLQAEIATLLTGRQP